MATSFSLLTGITVANGMTADSTLFNALVNDATFSSTTASIMIGFDDSKNATDIPYQFPPAGLLFNNTGSSFHGSDQGLTFASTTANVVVCLAQGSSNGLFFTWNYNGTPANAGATISTFSETNPIKFAALAFSFDTGSQANAVQITNSGRSVFSAAVADDGINQLQVTGGFGFDRQVAYVSSLSYSTSMAIAYNAGTGYSRIAISGTSLTLTTSNLFAGAGKVFIISNASSASASLAFPGWIFLNSPAPSSIVSGKTAVLSTFSNGTTDAAMIAAYAVQP